METWQLKYVKFQDRTSPWGNVRNQRMVNQQEIVEYYKHNPGNTERQMQIDVYGFDRYNSLESNKKYADCLRRALYSGKLGRVQARTPKGMRYIYYVK